jgi:uncharacterized DUF497 family protein
MNVFVLWDLDDDNEGNVQHIAEHGLTKEDVENVLEHPQGIGDSRSSDRKIAFGYALSGEKIAVLFDIIDEDTVRPVTAYEVDDRD